MKTYQQFIEEKYGAGIATSVYKKVKRLFGREDTETNIENSITSNLVGTGDFSFGATSDLKKLSKMFAPHGISITTEDSVYNAIRNHEWVSFVYIPNATIDMETFKPSKVRIGTTLLISVPNEYLPLMDNPIGTSGSTSIDMIKTFIRRYKLDKKYNIVFTSSKTFYRDIRTIN
jgi:hypothetical protein